MRVMRILVTGSRDWPDAQPIWDALSFEMHTLNVTTYMGPEPPVVLPGWELVLVHGAAKGADAFAEAWARHQQNEGWPVRIEGHPANWSVEGRGAGILRNLRMIQIGPQLCLAFIRANSRGATHCATAAAQHGIETRIVRWVEAT